MAKLSYVISKNSSGNGKQNFHFDGGTGSGKWFSKIFKNGKEEHSSDPNEVVDLISKLVIDGDYSINKNSETRIEFEGSTEEIKEFALSGLSRVRDEVLERLFTPEEIVEIKKRRKERVDAENARRDAVDEEERKQLELEAALKLELRKKDEKERRGSGIANGEEAGVTNTNSILL